MTKLCNILSSSFGCLAVALLVLGVLTVSPYVWAEDPTTCSGDSDCGSDYACLSGICVLKVNCSDCSPCEYPCDDSCFGADGCGTQCSCYVSGSKCACR